MPSEIASSAQELEILVARAVRHGRLDVEELLDSYVRLKPGGHEHIDNMRRVCEAGAVVLPASPGWYHGVSGVRDLVDFVVARILDQLNVEHALMRRWGEGSG